MAELPDADDLLEDDDLTDSVPRIMPVYADATYQELGERLAALYFARDTEGGDDEARNEAILRTAAAMRKGARLHAGEFLADGRYRLIDQLSNDRVHGHWKAWDRVHGRFVYLSVFYDAWTDDAASVDAFRRRGIKLVKLDHANIGKVFDADRSQEGWVYVAQSFFAVGNLKGRVTRDGFDAFAALQVIVEVADALRHAHDAGVVHGDVRPGNVMHSADGTAHLVDFAVGPSAASAGWGSLYAAPETSEKDYVPQPAADVYGLGMMALFALHRGDLPVWVLRDPARLIEAVDAPEAVKRVVGKATEWDLSRRYPDVRTLLRELMSDPELVRTLADRALDRDRLAVGAGHFEKLLKTQPHRGVEYRTILGDVYTRMGAYDKAHAHLAKALERTPDVEALFRALRVVAERTNQWGRLAELLWTQARQRDAGRRVLLRAELADINENQLDDATSAREVWGQVLSEHRTPTQAMTALRALMRLTRDAKDGEAFVAYGKELLDYLVDGAEVAEVEYAIGRTLIEQLDRVDEGLPWIDRAEGHGHSELDFASELERIRAERGQWRRVIKLMIAQARQQDLASASPTLLRAGIIAGSVHHEEEAFEVYHSLLERAPRHVVALRHLARMHHRAHQHERALPFYERLWDTYKGRDTEEPEASERAADCAAYAAILLRQGRAEEAMERLHEALRLTPYHVPSLQTAGPMLLARGDVDAAGDVFDRLLRAFKSVERTPQKVEACLGMGDLAWIQGRITPAMGWYNRALELEPFSVRGWWGLAKVALTARGGHDGVDRAPWVKAVPKRFATSEALARLLVAMLDPDAMAEWLRLTPLGQAIVQGGASPMRLACGVAEVLIRNELAGAELYDRLGEAFPAWVEPIDVARALCTEGRTSDFPLHVAYGWSAPVLGDEDFDPDAERHVLPPEPAPIAGTIDALTGPAAWSTLFQRARTEPPPPKAWIQTHEPAEPELLEGPVAALVRDQSVWLLLDRSTDAVRFGREDDCDMQIIHDDAVVEGHGRLYRQAGRIYIEAGEGGVRVDGEERGLWRLVSGERVTIGETRFTYSAVDDVEQLPPKRRKPVRRPPPKPPEPAPVQEPEASDEDAEELPTLPDLTADDDPSVELSPMSEEVELDEDDADLEATQALDMPPEVQAMAARLQGAEPGDVEAEEAPADEPPADHAPVEEEVGDEAGDPQAPEEAAEETAAEPVVASDAPPPGEEGPPEPQFLADLPSEEVDLTKESPDELLEMPSLSEEVPREEVEAMLAKHGMEPAPAHDEDAQASAESDLPQDPSEEEDEVVERVAEPDDADAVPDDGGTPSEADAPGADAFEPEEASDAEVMAAPADDASSEEEPVADEPGEVEAPNDVEDPVAADDLVVFEKPAEAAAAVMEAPTPTPQEASWDVEVVDAREVDPASADAPPVPVLQGTPVIVDAPPPVREEAEPPSPTLAPDDGPEAAVDDDEAGVFGFPAEFASDDVEALQAEPDPLPSGVRGLSSPSMPPEPIAAMAAGQAAEQVGDDGAMDAPSPDGASPKDDGVDGLFASPEEAASGLQAVLEYMSGADRGQQVAVDDVLTVGQSKHCGMSIPGDSRLSPVHCKVERSPGGFKLIDEASANGTVVNGARITEIDLSGGEVIMVGRTVLRFRILEEG
mgnify:CR=1 FL=1